MVSSVKLLLWTYRFVGLITRFGVLPFKNFAKIALLMFPFPDSM
jgi:hypothetical protein